MDQRRKPCVFPSPTEMELGVVSPSTHAGPAGTAIRVRVEPGRDGYARLEQLAYGEDVGWYVQKSFCIPGEMIEPLVTQLRKADCFVDKTPQFNDEPIPFPAPSIPKDDDPQVEKQNA